MGAPVTTATPFVGNTAGDQMSQTMDKDSEANTAATFSPEELAQRRQTSRRLAWILGTIALALYLAGFLLKR